MKKLLCAILAAAVMCMDLMIFPAAAVPAYPHEDDVTQSPLYGKKALFVGDSITFAVHDNVQRYGWAGRIGSRYSMNWTNNGVSGTMISTNKSELNLGRIVDQLKKAQGETFDYVILHGGINDAGYSTPAGVVSDSFNAEDFDLSTYAGGLEELICTAIQLFGVDTHIGYLTTFRTPNHLSGFSTNMTPYYTLAHEICEKWGIDCYDMYADDALNAELDMTDYTYTRDFLHPNSAGYDILAPYIANWMETIHLFDYERIMGKRWEQESATIGALDPQYFSEESYADLQEALASEEPNLYERTENLKAVAAQLKSSGMPLPFDLWKGNRYYGVLDIFGVANAADFAAFAEAVNSGELIDTAHVIQTADVDLSGYRNVMVGVSAEHPFAGVYDGRNFTLKNALLTRAADHIALFPYLKGTLKNLNIENAIVQNAQGGSAVAVAHTVGTKNLVENVHLHGCILAKTGIGLCAALLVCEPASDSDSFTIRNCSVSSSFLNILTDGWLDYVGVIAGRSKNALSRIENCYSFRNTVKNYNSPSVRAVGGLIGESVHTELINCGVAGNQWIGEFTKAHGGLVGNAKSGNLTITDCYVDDDLPVVGQGDGFTVNRCWSREAGTLNDKDVWNGALALQLGDLTGNNWVQNSVPMVMDGKKPTVLTVRKDGVNVGELYTDREGRIAASPDEMLNYGRQFRLNGNLCSLENLLAEEFTDTAVIEALGAGDVNMDGKIDLLDALWILRYLSGNAEALPDAYAADVTEDGAVNTADLTRLLRDLENN